MLTLLSLGCTDPSSVGPGPDSPRRGNVIDTGGIAQSDTTASGDSAKDSAPDSNATPDSASPIDTGPLDTAVPDLDGDGYPASEDCADADAAVYPGATEVCGDAIDNDCDAEVDSDAAGAVVWHPDSDADGYGAIDGILSCDGSSPDAAYIIDGSDCHDADSSINPSQVDECGAPFDVDCDGTDEACEMESGGWWATGPADLEGNGSSYLTLVPDVDGDELPELLWSNDEWLNLGKYGLDNAGRGYLLRSTTERSGMVAMADSADLTLVGPADEASLGRFASAGDIDGDGLGDVVICGNDQHGPWLFRSADLIDASTTAGAVDEGVEFVFDDWSWLPTRVLPVSGDWTGDGASDMAVALSGEGVAFFEVAQVFDAARSTLSSSEVAVIDGGAADVDTVRQPMDIGDIDGDGLTDHALFVETDGATQGWCAIPSVTLVSPGTVTFDDVCMTVHVDDADVLAGHYDGARAADVTADGVSDLLIVASTVTVEDSSGREMRYAGRLVVIDGAALSASGAMTLDDHVAEVVGSDEGLQVGWTVQDAGDADGDGRSEVWTSRDCAPTWVACELIQFRGSTLAAGGTLEDTDADVTWEFPADTSYLALEGGADLDGDTIPDIAVLLSGDLGTTYEDEVLTILSGF